MADNMTILPKCKRCQGAFYASPDAATWTHDLCADCIDVGMDEYGARMNAAYLHVPYAPICFAYRPTF